MYQHQLSLNREPSTQKEIELAYMTLKSKSERTSLCCSRTVVLFALPNFQTSFQVECLLPKYPYKDQPYLMAAEPNFKSTGAPFFDQSWFLHVSFGVELNIIASLVGFFICLFCLFFSCI